MRLVKLNLRELVDSNSHHEADHCGESRSPAEIGQLLCDHAEATPLPSTAEHPCVDASCESLYATFPTGKNRQAEKSRKTYEVV